MQARIVGELVFSLLSSALPGLLVLMLAMNFIGVVVYLLATTSVGLWMRQFNVPSWGRDEDPLPPTLGDPRDEPRQEGTWQPPYDIPTDPQ